MRVAGADVCRGGWLVAEVRLDRDGTPGSRPGEGAVALAMRSGLGDTIAQVRRGELAALGVDIPIGLPERGTRLADREARQLLGPRRSSLFPTPPRAVLDATEYADALARCRALDGRGLSRQAFGLLARMRQVAAVVDPDLWPAVAEVHPETSFAVMGTAPCRHPKHRAAGRAERCDLLRRWGVSEVDQLVARRPPGTGPADVLDALAAAWTAARIATGRARWLGEPDGRDALGLRLTIAV